MTDESKPKPTVIPAMRIEGFGTSEDGRTMQMNFSGEAGDTGIVLTIPTTHAVELHRELGNVLEKLRLGGGAMPIGKWKIGESNDPRLKGKTAILFDENTSAERLYLLDDADALRIADAIEEKVFKGLSAVDKRRMVEGVQRARGKGIILPPGHRPN